MLFKIRLTLFTVFTFALCFVAKAHDTVSAKGIEFTPIETKTPAAKATGTSRYGGGSKTPGKQKTGNAPGAAGTPQKHQTLWAIFLSGFIGGCAAFFMPCIFPMVPLTISFFTKGPEKKSGGVIRALVYGISIIVIYVVLGLLITVSFGATSLNNLATNGIFNMAFFIVLVIFAASFLGAFEITLPSRWVNAADAKSDQSGMAGLFFMAATLALVSFSCTGPIVGTLLVQAATTGALLGPAVGMLGYSFALAIPFVVFAMFPALLTKLPKSGSWLNSVKVVLGFLELALSLKFLSNVDLAYHWHLFDREVFLVLWIVTFAMMGFYLLGKIRFSHDSAPALISVPRLFLAITVLSFTLYMVPGLWGAPLKSISALLPPMATQDFDLSAVAPGGNIGGQPQDTGGPRKYAGLFDKPRGFDPFFDYDEGLAYARKVHKPVMIDFTGHACVNCRKMEANVWPDKLVYQILAQEYVLIQLYVDDKTELAAAEQLTTPEGGKLKTIGDKWSYLQTSRFVSNSQPFYVLLNPDTQAPLAEPRGAEYDPGIYQAYLSSGLKAFDN
ncbi:protein-disulfide reductase DsbD family protein [Mucilaginibacter kameinonensis]|uniref:protein-disulfide reductase DsbD family protein n=1 Tax=Mucilaginibacter kameinonensis TaxID=452286 RepID=UPI000EF848DC|nr:cytochrome c biogenesis protein CcdA [Mucilaginibacter kameinonensis]